MYKKAGIIVSITIIILAIIVWVVGNKIGGKGGDNVSSLTENQQVEVNIDEPDTVENNVIVDNNVNSEDTESTNSVQADTSSNTSKDTVNSNEVKVELTEEDLGGKVTKQKEIMLVSKKKVLLLDNNFGTDARQLNYCVELLDSENRVLEFYLNGTAYKGIEVGTKLSVEYEIYENDSGVKFPIISSVTAVQDKK